MEEDFKDAVFGDDKESHTMELKICHLYPDVLNLYGDRGNIQCLQRRLTWRGIACQVEFMGIGDHKSLSGYDLFFIGGGQDFDQEILLEDLRLHKGTEIRAALEDGKTFLCICGGYQMMGHYYETADGVKCEFLGAIDFYTVGGQKRMIGNFAFRLGEESGGSIVVGFENHSGRTFLGSGVHPLGRILEQERRSVVPRKQQKVEHLRRKPASERRQVCSAGIMTDGTVCRFTKSICEGRRIRLPGTGRREAGYGNNGIDHTEGARYKNAFCTYSHGPVLPKNPAFADVLLETALKRKYGSCALEPLPDRFEHMAHDAVLKRVIR